MLADVANVARALTAAVLLRRVFAGPPRLDDLRVLAGFVVSAALIAPAVGATIGAANVVLHDGSTTYWRTWTAWFLSNSLTSLTILPAFLLAIANRARWRWPPMDHRRAAEALALAGAVAATAAWAFLIPTAGFGHRTLQFYAPLPVLIWAALRFGSGGASVAFTAVAFAAILGADRGTGPFLESEPGRERARAAGLRAPDHASTALYRRDQYVAPSHRAAVSRTPRVRAGSHRHPRRRRRLVEVNESWRRFGQRADVAPFRRSDIGANFVIEARQLAIEGDTDAARVFAGVTSVLEGQQKRVEIEFDHYGQRSARAVCALH